MLNDQLFLNLKLLGFGFNMNIIPLTDVLIDKMELQTKIHVKDNKRFNVGLSCCH